VAKKKQMKEASNFERPALNADLSAGATTSNLKHRTSNIFWRILDFVLAGIFIFAGVTKAIDPVQFASDIDNFKILPWPVSVALAFYLPWLEIFCALGLVFRFLYRGALSILSASIVAFTLAITAAKVRGLDITCGCFGHASQHWSFPSHLLTNLAIFAVLVALSFSIRSKRPV
jgi:putative oxidoreductase